MTVIDPRGKLLAHMDRLAALQNGEVAAPINVEIDLSNRCSLGCEWCHFAFTHTRGPLAGKREKPTGANAGGDLMGTFLAKSIIDQLAVACVKSVTWTGGGEPTLHPDFDAIVTHAGNYPQLEQGIYTHGGHIKQERAELMKRAMTFVYVSLDAADPFTYKRDKGVDRFENACNGIQRLAEADGDATIGLGYLVTKDNWHAAADAARLAQELGADYVQFRPTILYDQQNPDHPAENTAWLKPAIEHLSQVADDHPNVIVDLDRFKMYERWETHGYHTCWWSALQTVVTPNGKLWTCVNKREHPAAELGDLSVEPFVDIWARRPVAEVTGDCRVLCRGHIPNTTLTEIMAPREHEAFV